MSQKNQTITQKVEQLLKNKDSQNNGIYNNLDKDSINQIISLVQLDLVNKLQETIDVASDEAETVTVVQQVLDEIKTKSINIRIKLKF